MPRVMLKGGSLLIGIPSLNQDISTGGPPLVFPNKVKVGGSDSKEDMGERETTLEVIAPAPEVRTYVANTKSANFETVCDNLATGRENSGDKG